MTTEATPLTLSEISDHVEKANGLLKVAAHGLEVGGTDPERAIVTGYAGSSALRHLRYALKELEKVRTQLRTVVPE